MNRLLFALVLPVLFFITPVIADAQIVKCGGPDQEMCTPCHVFGLVSGALVYLVAIITLVITLVIVWSGILITTSKGDASAVSQAKSMLTNAIVGFVILITAWLIVDTMLKVLVKDDAFGRPWNTIDATKCAPPALIATPVTPGPGGAGSTTPPVAGCTNCTPLPAGIPRKVGLACGNQCQIHPDLGAALVGLAGDAEGWQLTESWPPSGYAPGSPSGYHRAACHGDATCVDAGFADRDYSDPNRVNSFITSASSRGLTAVFETNSQSRYNAYRAAGINVVYVAHATADHFSVYACSTGAAASAIACRN